MIVLANIWSLSAPARPQNSPAGGYIPVEWRIDWSNAGLLPQDGPFAPHTPVQADVRIEVEPDVDGNSTQSLESALSQAKTASKEGKTTVIYFPAGVHRIDAGVVDLTHEDGNNIVFQGAGANSTTLEFTVGNDGTCMLFQGITEIVRDISTDIAKGDRIVKCADGFQPGDWVWICESGFDIPGDPTKNIIGQVNRIEGRIDDGFALRDEASKRYLAANGLKMFRILPICNIGIENLTVRRMDDSKSTCKRYSDGCNLFFNYAVNCWVKGVISDFTCRHHIYIDHSSHIEVTGCYIHHAAGYGNNSYGYGTVLGASTTNCLIENNIFEHLRHAMGIISGANRNVYAFNFSTDQHATWHPFAVLSSNCYEGFVYQDSDICLHGRYPFANLFEHNIIEFIEADATHGDNGPFNAFVRNIVWDKGEIFLYHAENASVLGNLQKEGTVCKVTNKGSGPLLDIYGFIDGHQQSHAHFASGSLDEKEARLPVVSCYYSMRPNFLPESFTWPTLGCRVNDEPLTQDIPARMRYNKGGELTCPAEATVLSSSR